MAAEGRRQGATGSGQRAGGRRPTVASAGRSLATSHSGGDVLFFWSGGKESAVAYHRLVTEPRYEGFRVSRFLTTFTEGYDRVTGHGVRRGLVEWQARCLGIELEVSYIPKRSSMGQYISITSQVLRRSCEEEIRWAATGDIFVEKERMALLDRVGMRSCCPLWRRNPRRHVEELLDLGFRSYVVCVDGRVLDGSFAGRLVDHDFLRDLPTGVDPSGENGEYHTFAFDGPIFDRPVPCRRGEIVEREGFVFCDLLPEEETHEDPTQGRSP